MRPGHAKYEKARRRRIRRAYVVRFCFFFLEPRIYVRFECANPRARTDSVKRAWTLKKNSGRTEFDRDYDGSGECKNENTPETNVDVGDATTVRRIWRVRVDSLNFLNKYYVL